MMNGISWFLWLALLSISCHQGSKVMTLSASGDLVIKQIKKNLFVHESYLTTNDFGKVACNGMIFINGDEAIVFDTPANEEASRQLLNWIQHKQGKHLKALVVTHFHEDCLGGIAQFHERGIQSIANNRTLEILEAKGENADKPRKGFEHEMTINVGAQEVQLLFFGEGHTKDNIVGFIPSEKTLFGGCLMKSMGAGKGFLGDANTEEWSNTVMRIKETLPNLKTVIPGHGNVGGNELLDYTIQLFRS